MKATNARIEFQVERDVPGVGWVSVGGTESTLEGAMEWRTENEKTHPKFNHRIEVTVKTSFIL